MVKFTKKGILSLFFIIASVYAEVGDVTTFVMPIPGCTSKNFSVILEGFSRNQQPIKIVQSYDFLNDARGGRVAAWFFDTNIYRFSPHSITVQTPQGLCATRIFQHRPETVLLIAIDKDKIFILATESEAMAFLTFLHPNIDLFDTNPYKIIMDIGLQGLGELRNI